MEHLRLQELSMEKQLWTDMTRSWNKGVSMYLKLGGCSQCRLVQKSRGEIFPQWSQGQTLIWLLRVSKMMGHHSRETRMSGISLISFDSHGRAVMETKTKLLVHLFGEAISWIVLEVLDTGRWDSHPFPLIRAFLFSSTEGLCIGLVILLLRIPKAGKHTQHTSQKSILRLSED